MNLNDLVRKCLYELSPVIRRVSPFDNQQILNIEQTSGIKPWRTEDFKKATSLSDAGFLVANESSAWNAALIGFVLFNLDVNDAHIRRLSVLQEFRRENVASGLLSRAEESIGIASNVRWELGEERIRRIVCEVPETCVEMQCLLAKHGYKIVKTHREHGECDLYEFEKLI